MRCFCVVVGLLCFYSTVSVSESRVPLLQPKLLALVKMSHRFSRQDKAKWVANPPKLKLRSPIRLPECDNQDLIVKNNLTLVGRVTNPRVQNAKALVHYMLQFWNLDDRVSGKELGPGRFQFSFKREEDLQLVLSWSPFHFKHWMFILQRWEPVISEDFPSNILFWIQLQGVPQHYWTEKALRTIGEDLGKVEVTDTDGVRIRVHINALLPLEKQVPIMLPSGEVTLVTLEYERLEKHCFDCFSLAHEKKDCPNREESINRADQDCEPPLNSGSQRDTRKDLQGSRNQRERREPSVSRRRFESPRRRFSRSPTKRRSPTRDRMPKETSPRFSPRRREDQPRRSAARRPQRFSREEQSRRRQFSLHDDRNSESRYHHSEWRRRRSSPQKTRSFQDTTSGAGRESRLSHREASPHRPEILNTPPPSNKTTGQPAALSGRLGSQSSPRARRPALERLSGRETALDQNQGQGISSSMSGRLQDVNIQYLGEEGQACLANNNNNLLVGDCSDTIHPTLGHRLSLGQESSQAELRRPASLRLEQEQPEVTITIPAKIPKPRANPKRKGTAAASVKGTRSPLQGACSRKRNATNQKGVSAKKRLCQDQIQSDLDPATENQGAQPPVILIPAAKKAKSKVDFPKPPNPLP